jgi:capsular exopolysaccharide synthesis family protein
MGYVFDALKKAGGQKQPDEKQTPPELNDSAIASDDSVDSAQADVVLSYEEAVQSGENKPGVQVDIQPPESLPEQLDDRLVGLIDPGCLMSEEYRSIRTRILARWQHRRHLVHTITSATPKEGKTLTTLNLGAIFSEMSDRRTVLVECDLRLPMFSRMLGGDSALGLLQVLEGDVPLDDALQMAPRENLSLLPAGGRANDDATRVLSLPQMTELISQLRKRFDHVIIDTPPVLSLADAGIVGAQSDDVLLVVRMNRTPQYLVDEAMRSLNGYNAPVTGAVLTDMRMLGGGYSYGYRYGYRYRYGYGYGYTRGQRRRRSA